MIGLTEILSPNSIPAAGQIRIRPFSSVLSTLYIAGIFILPRVIPDSLLSRNWNPYSLLHIPLYGILMILLTLTFEPHIFFQNKLSSGVSFSFLPGGIATVVGVLDEFHQSFIPYRDASVGDVMLDIVGIGLAVILIRFNRQRRIK